MTNSAIPLFLGCASAVIIGILCGFWMFTVIPGIILFGLVVIYLQEHAEKQDKTEKK